MEALGTAYVASLILGSGQFCTNPGVVFAIDGPDLDRFVGSAATALAVAAPQVMLTEAIHRNFDAGVERLVNHPIRDSLAAMTGQLTATLHLDAADHDFARPLIPLFERTAGRILANGCPTGVEVAAAMVHGGPFPATSDARTTSVGAAAIERFLRPVCYQDVPDDLLPAAVKRGNPLVLPRLIDGDVVAGAALDVRA